MRHPLRRGGAATRRSRLGVAAACLCALSGTAHAQLLDQYLPNSFSGYGVVAGLPVMQRPRPEFESAGIHAGGFIIRPMISEGIGWNSNPSGQSGGSSAYIQSQGSVSADSDWSRDSLGMFATAGNTAYLEQPRQNVSNWSLGGNGSYDIGRDTLALAAAHVSSEQVQTSIGALQTSEPVPFDVNTVRARYTTSFGRLSLTPNVDFTTYRYGDATFGDVPVSQKYRDYNLLSGGVTGSYAVTPEQSAVVVLRGFQSDYVSQPAGQPSRNSTSFMALVGTDYAASGSWRYRLLGGIEQRQFADSAIKTHTAPVIEAAAIWTPTLRTTITGTVVRAIEDAASATSVGYVYTGARLVVDHEYQRNILLRGYASVQVADSIQGGGHQTVTTAGASATWLITRNLRGSLRYDFQDSQGSTGLTTTGSGGSSNSSMILLALEFAL